MKGVKAPALAYLSWTGLVGLKTTCHGILVCSPFLRRKKMSEEAKQAILDFMVKKKGKTKHYFSDLCKAVPDMKMRQAKKIINELINEGKLKYWSSGGTTLYELPRTVESDQ
jgi:hypothetical protein